MTTEERKDLSDTGTQDPAGDAVPSKPSEDEVPVNISTADDVDIDKDNDPPTTPAST